LHVEAGKEEQMPDEEPIAVEAFYAYGYRGKDMIAIVSPFAMSASASEIIGHTVRVGDRVHKVLGVARQISVPIQKGEPIGIETSEAGAGKRAAHE
jgi:hypothetical protein